jgi:flagellar motor switch/type III secretory pathway protein FliN
MRRSSKHLQLPPGFAEILPAHARAIDSAAQPPLAELGQSIAEIASRTLKTTLTCTTREVCLELGDSPEDLGNLLAWRTELSQLVIDPRDLVAAVDNAHGGEGLERRTGSHLTATDMRVARQLAAEIDKALAASGNVVPSGKGNSCPTAKLGFTASHGGDERPAMVVSFLFAAPDSATTFQEHEAATWLHDLQTSVLETRHKLRLVIARPEVALERLARLQSGDFIEFVLPARVPVTVDGYRLASGTIGVSDGRTAIRLEHVETEIWP